VIRIAWRSLVAHKLRTVLTMLAILVGVAMISGTYVLTDQIDSGFKSIFTDAYKGTDVTVTRKAAFTGDMTGVSQGLPQSMVKQVQAVDGVAEAVGYVASQAAVAVNGKVVETGGAPTLFFSYHPSDMSSTTYFQGQPPTKSGEIGIIQKLATDKHLHPGSMISVITQTGAEQARVSGVFKFAAESSLGGSLILQPTIQDAQRWFDMQGRVSEIDAKAVAGTSADTLAARIKSALPRTADVKTGAQAAADQTKQISDAIGGFLRPALLSFGGIAVLVGAFIIFNVFSMIVGQRRREFAMLRALGASRNQIMASVTVEALLMGILASLVGLFAGLGVASGVNALFKALNIDIPHSGLILAPRTIVLALAVGVIVTMLSAVVPALRATRVPPIAALQEGATLPRSRFARFSPYAAGAFGALGALLLVAGMYGPGSTSQRLGTVALGAVIVFVAVAMVSKYFARPVARALGWPLQLIAPVSGRLARDNSARNPARTAATASALMIGLGVVVFVAVFAQGLKSSFVDSFDATVKAGYVVQTSNFLPLPTEALSRTQSVPSVQDAAGLYMQQVQVAKKSTNIMGIDPYAFSHVWRFDWLNGGSDKLLTDLGSTGALVEQQTASSLGLKVGKRFTTTTAEGGKATFTMIGEYRDPIMLNGVVLGTAGYAKVAPKPQLFMVFASATPGANGEQTLRAIKASLADLPTAKPQTAQEYKDSTVGMVNQLLNLLYGLLAMSVLISIIGIVITLLMAVHERTREIGLSRAIGMSRRQVRATVRYESVITSVIGALMGIVVGVVFAWVVTTKFAGQGITFSVPGGQLVIFLIVGVLVGIVAAIFPAWRATRIDILQAIQSE
jgi:putative ABC transport system permease protein